MVRFRRFDQIAFVESVPEEVRERLEELGGEILEDVRLDDPGFPPRWRDGASAPRMVLHVARADPKCFRVFDDSSETDRSGFERIGPNFAPYSASQFESFIHNLWRLEQIAAHTDEHDTDEAWDTIMRELSRFDEPAAS